MKWMVLPACALLAACGSTGTLKRAPDQPALIVPYGGVATPTPKDLLTPGEQARPQRSNELLQSSQERRSDEFDLPPR